MGGEARKQRASARACEMMSRQSLRRLKCRNSKASHQYGMTGDAEEWSQGVLREVLPMFDDGLHKTPP
jgi:hypothetical protein